MRQVQGKEASCQKEKNICVAEHGFKFEAKIENEGYNVEIVVPEWVTTELLSEVLLKNLNMLVSAINTLKSGLEFLGYALKGIKKDTRAVFEKHRND